MMYRYMARVLPAAVTGALIVSLGPLVTAGSAGASPRVPVADTPAPTAYVSECGTNEVVPIDTATNKLGSPIKVGQCPTVMAVTPDGSTIYVGNSNSDTVTPITTATDEPGKPIAVGSSPDSITITPNGRTAYVITFDIATGQSALIPISTATNKAGAPIQLSGVDSIAITSNSKTIYAVNGGEVVPVSTATGTVGTPIQLGTPLGYGAYGVVITPNGKTAFVLTYDSQAGDADSHGWSELVPVSTATNTAASAPILIPNPIAGLAITPNGKDAFVVRWDDQFEEPVVGFNAITYATIGSTTDLGPSPSGIVIAPNGKTAYVASYTTGFASSEVTPITTATVTAEPPIVFAAGTYTTVGGITPNGETLYAITDNITSGAADVVPIAVSTNMPGTAIGLPNNSTPEYMVITP